MGVEVIGRTTKKKKRGEKVKKKYFGAWTHLFFGG